MRHHKLQAWVLLALCSGLLLIGSAGVSAGDASSRSHPSAGRLACEQGHRGSFEQLGDLTKCTVNSALGTIVYAGSGAPGFNWVQVSTYAITDGVIDGVQLGPASVGCSKPAGSVSADWVLDCI